MVDTLKSFKSDFGARSKYERFCESIKKRILKGEFSYKSKLPSDSEFASLYSLSRPTVAKAMGELENIGLIERKVGDGSYVIYKQPEAMNIGLLIPGLGDQYSIFNPICANLANFAQQNNAHIIWGLSISEESAQLRDTIDQATQRYIDSKVAGIVYVPAHLRSEKDHFNKTILHKLDKANIPVVLLDRDIVQFPDRSKYDLVTIDNFRAGYLVTKHVLESGIKRIDFITEPVVSYSVDLRIQGYKNALLQNNIVPHKDWVHHIEPDNLAKQHHLFHAPVEAVICSNDLLATKYLSEFSNHFSYAPDTIKVAGFEGLSLTHYYNPPLTTFQEPCEQIGKLTFQVLMNRIKNKNCPTQTIFAEGSLIIRQSTRS